MAVYYALENSTNTLKHYGIKGMKWGVRRFQNSDGTLTSAGKKRYGSSANPKKAMRKDIKADMERAYKTGKTGTYMGYASTYAEKMAAKTKHRYEKALKEDPTEIYNSTLTKRINSEAAEKTRKEINARYEGLLKEAKDDVARLKEKYGDEAIKDITYNKKTGKMNEQVITGEEVARSIKADVGIFAIGSLGGDLVVPILYKKSAANVGRQIANNAYLKNIRKIQYEEEAKKAGRR